MTPPRVFTKTKRGVPPDYFAAEARGRDFLDVAGGPPLPAVFEVSPDQLTLEWIEPGGSTEAAAGELGRALARMHRAAPPGFGAAADGFIGSLALDNTAAADWPTFYAERRLAPYLPSLPAEVRRPVERVCERIHDLAGPAEPPARIHGDLWSGNVLWAADGRGWLVDAASAHGGHRETDLAMLQLFGAPRLDVILSAYDEEWPLADGWRDRVRLHQLHPLLVHAVMFGGGYVGQVAQLAVAALAGLQVDGAPSA
jgi:fructosamine-3-kinase